MDDDDFLSESTAEEDLDEELEGEPDFFEDDRARTNEERNVETIEEDDLEVDEDAFDDVTGQDVDEDLDDLTEDEDEASDFELGSSSRARRSSQRTRQTRKGKQSESKRSLSTDRTQRKRSWCSHLFQLLCSSHWLLYLSFRGRFFVCTC
jgi:hypothetical protein